MTVRTLMKRKPSEVITVPTTATLPEAARLLMRHGIGGLPVVDAQGALVGLLSERGLVDALDRHGREAYDQRVATIMDSPAPVCGAEDAIHQVMERMTRDRLRHLVVVDGGRITGVISVGDLVKNRLEQLETETGVLRDYVAAQRARG